MDYTEWMLHAFIDESEYKDKYFILTALIVKDENLEALNNDLASLIFDYALTTGTSFDAELHGHDLMQQKKDWKGVPLNITASIYKRALGIVNKHASALFVETIDRECQRRKYTNPYNHRTIAIGYILERVHEYAFRVNDEATAYLDDHYTAPEGRKEFIQYKAMGTFGYKSSKLSTIKELDFYDSRTLMGLQGADLCCYIYQRKLVAMNANPRALQLQNKLWDIVEDIRRTGRQRIWP